MVSSFYLNISYCWPHPTTVCSDGKIFGLYEANKTHFMVLPKPAFTSAAVQGVVYNLLNFSTRLPVSDLTVPSELIRQLTAFDSLYDNLAPAVQRKLDHAAMTLVRTNGVCAHRLQL